VPAADLARKAADNPADATSVCLSRAAAHLQSPFFLFSAASIWQFELQRWALPPVARLHRVFMHAATSQTAAAARASDTIAQAIPAKSVMERNADAKRDTEGSCKNERVKNSQP
jgi:hypothetical protein